MRNSLIAFTTLCVVFCTKAYAAYIPSVTHVCSKAADQAAQPVDIPMLMTSLVFLVAGLFAMEHWLIKDNIRLCKNARVNLSKSTE